MDLFKLTPAEARFARAFARGKRFDEYATQGVGRAEAFDREKPSLIRVGQNGAKSQKDIGRLALTLPAIRSPVVEARSAQLRAVTVHGTNSPTNLTSATRLEAMP